MFCGVNIAKGEIEKQFCDVNITRWGLIIMLIKHDITIYQNDTKL